MAYVYKKLGTVQEITKNNIPSNFKPKTLIENNGTIHRISPSMLQTQADWNTNNPSSPSYINNKPDLTKYSKSVVYTAASDDISTGIYFDSSNKYVPLSDFCKLFTSGVNIRIKYRLQSHREGDIKLYTYTDVLSVIYRSSCDVVIRYIGESGNISTTQIVYPVD